MCNVECCKQSRRYEVPTINKKNKGLNERRTLRPVARRDVTTWKKTGKEGRRSPRGFPEREGLGSMVSGTRLREGKGRRRSSPKPPRKP